MFNNIQLELFGDSVATLTPEQVLNPKGYKGLYGFHKYWGKKPMETYGYLIESLTELGEVVCDPFLGSGIAALEAKARKRRFIGCDINPTAVGLSKLLVLPPDKNNFLKAAKDIEDSVREKIDKSYLLSNGQQAASHYLWKGDNLISVWYKSTGHRKVTKVEPTSFDTDLFNTYCNYKCEFLRKGIFFKNSRINAAEGMTIYDLFTPRALRNIELILCKINKYDSTIQNALKFCLTAAAGQMSNMVFAITNRGKTRGEVSTNVEVGSWVIGYWRPKLHFEINVWNCFESRLKKLFNALKSCGDVPFKVNFTEAHHVLEDVCDLSLYKADAIDFLKKLPQNSIHAVITDPPHSDRIPYLELSELWNTILGENVDYEKEIVVSNAKERGKTKDQYFNDMVKFITETGRVLVTGGVFALMFNARDNESWRFYEMIKQNHDLTYQGYFPVSYSANSVVQDNRDGSLKDFVLIFQKQSQGSIISNRLKKVKQLSEWRSDSPRKEY